MPRQDALKGALKTRYHFQRGPTGPCQPTRQDMCVFESACRDKEERVRLWGINYLCAAPAMGGTKVAPAERLIIRKRAF